MKTKSTIGLIALTLSLCACDGGEKAGQLEQRIAALESSNKALTEEVSSLRLQMRMSEWDKIAFLKPGDEGYTALKFDLGTIVVKIVDVKAYANGSKISLQIGNLASARVDGLKTTLEWGKVDEKGLPENDKAKSRDVTFNEALPAGAWTISDLILDGIPPSELGFVRLKQVTHRGIGLRR
jgi:hypothetical protein